MIPTIAVVPTRYEPDRLRALLDLITPEANVIVLDNGHEPPIAGTVDTRGMGIYAMWNLGWRIALERHPVVNVAILNDDIRILPGSLRLMARALRSESWLGCVYPDRSVRLDRGLPGRWRLTAHRDPIDPREMTGYCFMFKGELPLPPFDEGYEWWYGDTQFDESVKLAGYAVAQVDGLPIEHESDTEANGWARRPDLREAVERDGIRWAELHDRIEGGRWVPR